MHISRGPRKFGSEMMLVWAVICSGMVMHHCAISKKSCEKVAGKRRLCGKMWQGEESRGAIGNSSSIDPQKVGVAFVPSERVIMIPLRPKNVGPSLKRGHFAAISLVV